MAAAYKVKWLNENTICSHEINVDIVKLIYLDNINLFNGVTIAIGVARLILFYLQFQ